MNAKQHIAAARKLFGQMQTGQHNDAALFKIREHLIYAGTDLSALDRNGKKSHNEMEAELNEANRQIHIDVARRSYKKLMAWSGSQDMPPHELAYYDAAITQGIEHINEYLLAANADASVLDETGKQSEAEVLAAISKKHQDVQVEGARLTFQLLKNAEFGHYQDDSKPFTGFYSLHDQMWSYLAKAGVDASALDPDGKKTNIEMLAELQSVIKNAHIAAAQAAYISEPGDSVAFIRRHLLAAGVDASVLDKTGKKNTDEIEAELREAFKASRINLARDAQKQVSARSNKFDICHGIIAPLSDAVAGFAALDPSGNSSEASMRTKLHKEIVKASIIDAIRDFDKLRTFEYGDQSSNSLYDPDSLLGKIRGHLSFANVGPKALDQTGKKTDAEMLAELNAAHRSALKRLGVSVRPDTTRTAKPAAARAPRNDKI